MLDCRCHVAAAVSDRFCLQQPRPWRCPYYVQLGACATTYIHVFFAFCLTWPRVVIVRVQFIWKCDWAGHVSALWSWHLQWADGPIGLPGVWHWHVQRIERTIISQRLPGVRPWHLQRSVGSIGLRSVRHGHIQQCNGPIFFGILPRLWRWHVQQHDGAICLFGLRYRYLQQFAGAIGLPGMRCGQLQLLDGTILYFGVFGMRCWHLQQSNGTIDLPDLR